MATFAGLAFVFCPLLLHLAWSECGLDGKDGASKFTFKLWGRPVTRPCKTGRQFSKSACGCVKALDSVKNPENLLNGEISDISERPWAVLLASRCPLFKAEFKCSAVMIGAKWALTAEHCRTEECEPSDRSWLYGGSNKFWDGMTSARVRAFHYDKATYGDIMLVETCGWFYRKGTIEPISIMPDGIQSGGRRDCFRAAFGNQADGKADGYLREGHVTIQWVEAHDSACDGAGKKTKRGRSLITGICIHVVDNSKSVRSCNGDSGGGLVCPIYGSGSVTGYELLGVLHGGSEYDGSCAGKLGSVNQNIFFTSVPKFVPFIERYTKAPTAYQKGHRWSLSFLTSVYLSNCARSQCKYDFTETETGNEGATVLGMPVAAKSS